MPTDASSKCRTCLCESNNYHQLSGYVEEKYKILEMLDSVVPQIGIKTKSQFSSLVCHICVEKLLIGYKFQQSCIDIYNRLHDLLGITEFEKQPKLEEIWDPLTDNSKLKTKEKFMYDVCLESDTKDEDLDEDTKSSNMFLGDTDSSDDKLFTLKERASKLKLHKVNFPCNECEQVFSSLSKHNQHKCNHGKKQDVQESDLPNNLEEENIEFFKQEMGLTYSIFDTDHENLSDNSADVPFSICGKSKTKNSEFIGTDDMEKGIGRKNCFTCEICSKIFDCVHRLKKHKLVHSMARPHECDICNYRFATANFLKAHLFQHNCVEENSSSRLETLECPDCRRKLKKQVSVSVHRQSHRRNVSDGNYRCTVCQRSFMSKRSLTEHIRNKHPEHEEQKCDQCDKTFVLHAHLVEHLNRHHKGRKNVVCLICDKEFAHNKTLKEHMRTHSGESPYLCPQCGKTFRSASNLRQHVERHTGLKEFQCPECPSRFKCRSYLVKHAITHSNAKPHVCDICGSRFTRKTSMQKHKILHSGERPFKCDQCSMTFAVTYHLRRHMRTHTGEKPYKCKYCERAYAESGDLTKHLRTHVGENTYMCEECPMAFKYQAELRQHQSDHYKMTQKLLEKK